MTTANRELALLTSINVMRSDSIRPEALALARNGRVLPENALEAGL
ncbi:hypothetical protein [Bradyrhizobium forestalis]|nr:hypothetical protein [Bradyrhizobium forestalis]